MLNKFLILSFFTVATSLLNLQNVTAKNYITPEEARAIAKEAYIYGYPMVESYRIQYAYFIDRGNPEFKAPWNQIKNIPRVYTPEDKAVQTPNSDTPYSMLGADLRSEPLVLTVPPIEKSRYYSLQFIDLYTFNFAYVGSRTTGNDGGKYLLAGPNWKGDEPDGIKSVIRSETQFALVVYRTQLFNPDDIDNVKKIQDGYGVQTLSQYLGIAPASPAPAIDFYQPLNEEQEKTSVEFFDYLNFLLQFCPTDPSEKNLMEQFAKFGIGVGKDFDKKVASPEIKKAVQAGMSDAWSTYHEFKKTKINTGKVNSGDLFGTRENLKNNYLYRMAAAKLGIYGNSRQEAIYPIYLVDSTGQPLDGSKNSYTLHFAADKWPPVHAFWSLTMYELPSSLLVANPINRYLINSPMLPELKRDKDDGITIYIQKKSPGRDKESNWLPAPDGPFMSVLRLYWPDEKAIDGTWKNPPMLKVK